MADSLRALGADVRVLHWQSHDGTKELGKPQSLPAGWIEIPVGPGTASEAAAYFGGKRK